MDGRFFGIPPSSHHPAYFYSAPVHRQPMVKSPKVVSIPVRFVESEPMRAKARVRSRSESAAKLQAAFRAFMVRKYVRKINVVRREVEEIERRVCEEKTVDLLSSDERERLKVNEALMSLLIRLDSVRGVDAGVRDLRKKVIKKAIALQEKVDAIAAATDLAGQKEGVAVKVEQSEVRVDSPDQDGGSAEDEHSEEQVADLPDWLGGGCTAALSEESVLDFSDPKMESGVETHLSEEQTSVVVDLKKGCGKTEEREDCDIGSLDQEEGGADTNQDGSCGGLDHAADSVNKACDLLMEMEAAAFGASVESGTNPSLNPESFLEEVDENGPIKEDEDEQAEFLEDKEVEESAEENSHVGKDKKAGNGGHNNRSEEMLRRMMEDNEKMMGMMVQLFERNERQTQLLSLLSQRVERLEKAFLCEKLRRRKKREANDGARLLNSNKSGKKL